MRCTSMAAPMTSRARASSAVACAAADCRQIPRFRSCPCSNSRFAPGLLTFTYRTRVPPIAFVACSTTARGSASGQRAEQRELRSTARNPNVIAVFGCGDALLGALGSWRPPLPPLPWRTSGSRRSSRRPCHRARATRDVSASSALNRRPAGCVEALWAPPKFCIEPGLWWRRCAGDAHWVTSSSCGECIWPRNVRTGACRPWERTGTLRRTN